MYTKEQMNTACVTEVYEYLLSRHAGSQRRRERICKSTYMHENGHSI